MQHPQYCVDGVRYPTVAAAYITQARLRATMMRGKTASPPPPNSNGTATQRRLKTDLLEPGSHWCDRSQRRPIGERPRGLVVGSDTRYEICQVDYRNYNSSILCISVGVHRRYVSQTYWIKFKNRNKYRSRMRLFLGVFRNISALL